MENEKETITEQEDELVLKLADPYKYDQVEVSEINMDGLLDLTAEDLCELDRKMSKLGYSGMRMETTRRYAMLVAARINGKPEDYCARMGARDSIRLRDMVATFFYARA